MGDYPKIKRNGKEARLRAHALLHAVVQADSLLAGDQVTHRRSARIAGEALDLLQRDGFIGCDNRLTMRGWAAATGRPWGGP